jgi:uncharacterized protein YndB with AHSA1/START domain
MRPSDSTQQDAVVAEIEIAAPPERVFRALTDQVQLFAWWSKELSTELTVFQMDPRPGGEWRFCGKAAAGHDPGAAGEQLRQNDPQEFEAHGRVLECVPPRLLVWSWIASWHEHPEQETTVRWELMPTAAGTLVRVTHGGLGREPVARKDYAGGWAGMLKLFAGWFRDQG